ncbi:MAG TPA: hypothetical protein VF161_11150 [Steroidobacteraceae bacterium]|jgi:hypothetical protein
MSNVIEFLERMGEDADLRYASGSELDEALQLAGVDSAARAAILAGDTRSLEALLGAAPNVCCAIEKPQPDDEEPEEEDEDDDEEQLRFSSERVSVVRAATLR